MEKFSQFRDKGSGISPFIPVKTGLSPVSSVFHTFLFCVRLPIFLTYAAAYFLLLQHLPSSPSPLTASAGDPRRAAPAALPAPGLRHRRQLHLPIDALYLAAIFDPIFTISYPNTRAVERVSLLRAVLYALSPYPDRVVAVFPEGGTTNGKGVLPFTPSLLALGPDVHIFPVSIRYTPADITTPVPGRWFKFLWDLLSRPTTCIRVRVAESILNSAAAQTNGVSSSVVADSAATQRRIGGADPSLSIEEQRVLDKVGEALARLCRNKRVGLTLRDKEAFIEAWNGRK
ncbi:acyltransferase [Colletotrichum higginsianum]|nr:acyltransferase [Colletotrichum higginsianum]